MSANVVRGSIAPLLTVPACPIRQTGWSPAARSAASVASNVATSMRNVSSTGISRRLSLPSPSSSTAFWIELCASTDVYTVIRPVQPCSPTLRTSKPARVLRATAKPTRFAIDPPLTSRPLASAGNPSSSFVQSITWRSI